MKKLVSAVVLAILVPSFSVAGEGHDAGYRWAEQNGVDDPSYCYSSNGGDINNSPSFTEGCLEYLRDEGITNDDDEPVDEGDTDDDGGGGE